MAYTESRANPGIGWWLLHGLIGGIIAGIIFAMFEMIAAAAMMGMDAFFMPLRMIGGMVLGPQAMEPTYPLATAGLAGAAVHMVLSMMFGVAFGIVGAIFPALARSMVSLLVTTSLFGLALWLVNFYVIAPLAGWNWFPQQTNPVVQFLAHTFFFGTVLGIYYDRAAAALHEVRRTEVEPPSDIRRAA